jgi:hypothetical protein
MQTGMDTISNAITLLFQPLRFQQAELARR